MTGSERALIVGGGTMGTGIAAAFIAGGWAVDVTSRSADTRGGVPSKVEAMVRQCDKPFAAGQLAVHAGYGTLDWKSLLATAKAKTKAVYFVAEHDKPNDALRFARRSIDSVKKWM